MDQKRENYGLPKVEGGLNNQKGKSQNTWKLVTK
jgi:hypothetical protein